MGTKQPETSKHKLPPIIIVPNKTYIDDTGDVIPTDVILITDINVYYKMYNVIAAQEKEQKSILGKKGIIVE